MPQSKINARLLRLLRDLSETNTGQTERFVTLRERARTLLPLLEKER